MIGNTFYFFLYKKKFAFIEQYKATEEPWPWESNSEEWNTLFWRSVKFNLFNIFIQIPMLNAPLILFDVKLLNPDDYNVPTGMTLFAQLLFCSFIEDILFYMGHSTLHKPFFYKHIHKYHHEHKQTTSISCIHAHPFEFTFGNAVPSLVGSMILGKRMHISSQYAFGIIRYINSIDEHCGYKFPWSMQRILPFHFN